MIVMVIGKDVLPQLVVEFLIVRVAVYVPAATAPGMATEIGDAGKA